MKKTTLVNIASYFILSALRSDSSHSLGWYSNPSLEPTSTKQ